MRLIRILRQFCVKDATQPFSSQCSLQPYLVCDYQTPSQPIHLNPHRYLFPRPSANPFQKTGSAYTPVPAFAASYVYPLLRAPTKFWAPCWWRPASQMHLMSHGGGRCCP